MPTDIHRGTADLIAAIKETHRRRQDFHRAEKSLTLQIKAIGRRLNGAGQSDRDIQRRFVSADLSRSEGQDKCDNHGRDADAALSSEEDDEIRPVVDTHEDRDNVVLFATLPLMEARVLIKKHRLAVERELAKAGRTLPVYATFVEPICGFGAIGLAQIIGEAGDLANYSNPAKLWKRMGLAVINGKSQRRVKDKEGAIEQGYSPTRRAIMFCIGDSLLKKQNAYRELYLARKVTEQAKVPDGTKMLWHRRAQRYAEKRLLRNLWRAWRDQQVIAPQGSHVSSSLASPTKEAAA